MNKLSVVEFKAYTDGYIGIEKSIFKNHVSSYFENDLFEYSNHEDDSYSYSLRRVFNTKEEAITFVNTLFDSMWGKDYYIKEILPTFKSNITADFSVDDYGSDFIDGAIEMSLSMRVVETSARKIKEIIYE